VHYRSFIIHRYLPVPFSGGVSPCERPEIPIPEWYPCIPIDDIPTLISDDVIISNDTIPHLRYGYFVSSRRPTFQAHPASRDESHIKDAPIPTLVLVSEEPPISKDRYLEDKQTKVPPLSGIQKSHASTAKSISKSKLANLLIPNPKSKIPRSAKLYEHLAPDYRSTLPLTCRPITFIAIANTSILGISPPPLEQTNYSANYFGGLKIGMKLQFGDK